MLEWEQRQLATGRPKRPIVGAWVARASDGSWYVTWRENEDEVRHGGWSIAQAESLDDPSKIYVKSGGLALRGDAQLVAEAWAAGLDRVLDLHSYCSAAMDEDEEAEREPEWAAASWECPCGAGQLDYRNIREAQLGARRHWRNVMRAALAGAAD